MQAGVGSAGIGGTERVELLDRPIGIDHHDRALRDPQPFHHARLAEHKLDELTKQADLRFLARGGIPPVKDADQPVRVALARRW